MSIQNQLPGIEEHIYAPFLPRLQAIYADMDRKYQEAAEYYGFECAGCEDNCCLTRFHHHTLLEYYYIYEGFKTLGQETQHEVRQKAAQVCRQTALADEKGQPVRLMCSLNSDGLCLLYGYRPMICRLFGIPHELQPPDAEVVYRPGCGTFSEQCLEKGYFKFDRTPFFITMAKLEMELKRAVGILQKVKMTVADMVVTF